MVSKMFIQPEEFDNSVFDLQLVKKKTQGLKFVRDFRLFL